MPRRRIWSETVPYATVTAPRTLSLLGRYDLGVLLAVRPDTIAALASTLARLRGAGISVAVWPMLEDADGRWANAKNHAAFGAFARLVTSIARGRAVEKGETGASAAATELVIDLEPAIDDVRAALASTRAAGRFFESIVDGSRLKVARDAYAVLARDVTSAGLSTMAVAVPMVLLDAAESSRWQTLLGTPVDGPSWSSVNVMLYTSIVEGWSRGLFDRADAASVLASACRATIARFGARGSVSIGAVGVGAFGDEPVYRSPAELRHDVAIARAAGVEDLCLFDLGGVLGRGPSEAWLDAFVETEAEPALLRETLRARAAVSIAGMTAASLGWLAPLLRRRA